MAGCKTCGIAVCAGVIGFGAAFMIASGPGTDNKKMNTGGTEPASMKMDDKMMAEHMAAWMKAGEVGEHHKKMQYFVGTWDAETHCNMTDTTSTGMMKNELAHGGRFLVGQFSGKMEFPGMAPQNFTGTSTMGYNNVTKQWEGTWIDSMTTQIGMTHGTLNTAGKEWEFTGECIDPMTSKPQKSRHVITVLDQNTHKMDFYMPGEDGNEMLGMTITYKRRG